MDRQEAYRLLGLETGDEAEEIRRKYRRLMHIYHPDSAGEEKADSLETAKRLNEAFRYLKKEGFALKREEQKNWGIRENKAAYCKRKIYMEDDLFGDRILLDTGAFGKFYWDPDLEPFSLLLKSLGEAAESLLERSERQWGEETLRKHAFSAPYETSEERSGEVRMSVKGKLLHLLLQEFIDPIECLDMLYPGSTAGGTGVSVYRLRCHLISENGRKISLLPEEGFPVSVHENRPAIRGRDGNRGFVSFPEDALHYIVTPLLMQEAAAGVLRAGAQGLQRGRGRKYIPAELELRVWPARRKDMTAEINREIEDTLGRYRAFRNHST